MKILVTGASGFVGGSFLRRYSSVPGLRVLGMARRPVDAANYLQADLTHRLEIPSRLQFHPDVVIHAAAMASPWGSKKAFYAHNVAATQNVIDYCRRNGLPRLLYISSASVLYREEHQLNLTESSPIGPYFVNDYAATKYAGEELLRSYEGQSVVLRPRAVFGPGDTVLFPRIVQAARRGALPLFTGQTSPVMGDLIYIDVLLDYIFQAAVAPRLQDSYNLTNNQAVDIQALLLNLLEQLELPAPQRRVSIGAAMRAASVIEWTYRLLGVKQEPPVTRYGVGVFAYSKTFDVRRALVDLGAPQISIDEGLGRFVAWQKAQWAQGN